MWKACIRQDDESRKWKFTSITFRIQLNHSTQSIKLRWKLCHVVHQMRKIQCVSFSWKIFRGRRREYFI